MQKIVPKMFIEAKNSDTSPNLIVQILKFIAFFIVNLIAQGVPAYFFAMPTMNEAILGVKTDAGFAEYYDAAMSVASEREVMLPTLFFTILGTLLSMLYCRGFELRPVSSMGVRREKALPHYFQGFALGIVLMSVIVGLSALTGATKINISPKINIGFILLYFIGFLIQGMSEEFIFRGYLMNSVGANHSIPTALAVSSIAFAAAHLANGGITVLAFINLTLFGVFAGLYMICFDDIWGVCAIHSVWNFTQGNIYGVSVSGSGAVDSVFVTTAASDKVWLTGGNFGAEGSIITTIVLLIASAAVLYVIIKRNSESGIRN